MLVTDLSLAGMQDTLRQPAMMPTTNAACQVTIVANHAGEYREGGISRKEFEAAVGRGVDFIVPFDARSVAAATNIGRPVADGRGKVASAILQITEKVAGRARRTPPAGAFGSGRWPNAEHVRPKAHRGAVAEPAACVEASAALPDLETAPPPSVQPATAAPPSTNPPGPRPVTAALDRRAEALKTTHARIQAALYDRIDATAATKLPREKLNRQILELIAEVVSEQRLSLHGREQEVLGATIVDNMLGLGPLEPCCATSRSRTSWSTGSSRSMSNGAASSELTDVRFRDNQHVMNVAQRIVTRIGAVDETSPICDARLEDGSRGTSSRRPWRSTVAPSPSASSPRRASPRRDGPASKHQRSCRRVLKIAAACRLNIVIGGTGSGKTTMLNAMSQLIDLGERVVTIETRLELHQAAARGPAGTRLANLEGHGEISMRDLVKNALRMRPDLIICGEVRGPRGHGHAPGHEHRPRRLDVHAPRQQPAGGDHPDRAWSGWRRQPADQGHPHPDRRHGAPILQVSRMRDGVRRVTHVTEVVGMKGRS